MIRLPANVDGTKGKLLVLLVAMYGLKDAPAAFMRAFGEQVETFEYDGKFNPINQVQVATRLKKRSGPGNIGSRDPTDAREGGCI